MDSNNTALSLPLPLDCIDGLLCEQPRPAMFSPNMSEEVYATVPGVRSSWLKHVLRSPAHLLQSIVEPQESTRSQVFGTLCHHAVLMGPSSLPVHIIEDDLNLNSKEGRDVKAHAQARKLHVLRKSDHARIVRIREMVMADKEIAATLQSPLKEATLRCDLPMNDGGYISCKVRFDCIPNGDFLFDLKFVSDARPDPFAYKIMDFGYHLQAAHYLAVWNEAVAGSSDNCKTLLPAKFNAHRRKFLFLAVEADPPHAIQKFMLSEDFIALGIEEWERAMGRLVDCVRSRRFPAYPDEIAILRPPSRTTTRFVEEMV